MKLRVGAFIFGCFFLLCGSMVLGLLGVTPGKTNAAQANGSLILISGLVFAFAGLSMIIFGLGRSHLAAKFAALALLAFVVAFNWIAFVPGERNFKRSVSTGWAETNRAQVSETEGRLVFGMFALLIDGLIVYGFIKGGRRKN